MIMPRFVFSASEVLTDSTRRLASAAWGRSPYNVYAATETSGIAAECGEHAGMHLFEDLVITEVVDDRQPTGTTRRVRRQGAGDGAVFAHGAADPVRDERQSATRGAVTTAHVAARTR